MSDYTSTILQQTVEKEVRAIVVEPWMLEELQKEQNFFYQMEGLEGRCSVDELREVLGAPVKIASEMDFLPNGYKIVFSDEI